ncbi:MAG TPA: CPBP family glutamic-type intramembrane protease [Acidimicrobiales bacterium]|nr:CPBP family glutamic-type intramembrane protease [Acidimicrobiales bacterium]
MTAVRLPGPTVLSWGAWAVAGAGIVALLARPWFLPAGAGVEWRVVFFVTLGLAGLRWPLLPERAGLDVSLLVLGTGAAGFVAGRALLDVPAGPRSLAVALGLNALAAVAEEAFFRRHLYALVEGSWGPAVAVVGTAVAFAAVHVTVWGWWVLPLDLAAGLVLSWQRAATGRWSVPAATHVLANSLALL